MAVAHVKECLTGIKELLRVFKQGNYMIRFVLRKVKLLAALPTSEIAEEHISVTGRVQALESGGLGSNSSSNTAGIPA